MEKDCTAKFSLHHLYISLLKVGRMHFLNMVVKGVMCGSPKSRPEVVQFLTNNIRKLLPKRL